MSDIPEPIDDAAAPEAAAGPTDAELRQLLAQARASGDEPLRRLLTSYVTLRRLASEMVAFIETREGAVTVIRTPLFQRVKELTRRS